ncbi:hypothetical protein NQZ68_017094 [Dissostichus eleginoides]|nr:hypothetical protein NQZ68_017094 [Dissostichus eleginoides]
MRGRDFLDKTDRTIGTHSVPNALSQEYLMHPFAGERPDNKAQAGSVEPVSTDSSLIVGCLAPWESLKVWKWGFHRLSETPDTSK